MSSAKFTRPIVPLRHYDEEGRIKPPWPVFASLLFLMRGYLIFIASASYLADGSLLLKVFYPDRAYFYASLFLGLPALVLLALLMWRQKLLDSAWRGVFRLLWPVTVITLLADLSFHVHMAWQSQWLFSWPLALTLVLDGLLLSYWSRSRLLSLMLADWQRRIH
ncbi:DUF2919 family protein [Aliiglaciecola sp. CAU 1673]|uniref:DUF2919 family protein n=1 Tax=Aliiglaciecola sp. CAU 1673 TaxID=3032595 RepID=UPI0023DB9B6E|nr:DUF2919 family protein [Aliiglaciecola sp. CAU 1673]MDF2177235.1 DUF2919 family protein [Aliiglaciecola sp. CAU 1673]